MTGAPIGISNFIGLKWVIFDNQPVPDKVIHEILRFIHSGAFAAPQPADNQ